jgi:hypothetical protein
MGANGFEKKQQFKEAELKGWGIRKAAVASSYSLRNWVMRERQRQRDSEKRLKLLHARWR